MQPENLWAPWRMAYIKQLEAPGPSPAPAPGNPPGEKPGPACFLCEASRFAADSDDGRRRLLLLRDQRGLIVLNRYPYTSGHLLVAAAEHLSDLTDLSPAQRAGIMELTALAQQVIRLAFNPQGYNIGINLGRCAGAGLPGHLHVHVVPRWGGDTNFMQAVGNVRVIPQALEESYQALRDALARV